MMNLIFNMLIIINNMILIKKFDKINKIVF